MATITEPVLVGEPQPMLSDLYMSIEKHIEDLKNAIDLAMTARENGLVDFLSARQAASQKFCWMLRVSIEKEEMY
jgi:DNA-binding ferritin-like protein